MQIQAEINSGARPPTGPLKNWIDRQAPHPVLLRSHYRTREGLPDRRWRVLADHSLETVQ